jgi:hypothetical protein
MLLLGLITLVVISLVALIGLIALPKKEKDWYNTAMWVFMFMMASSACLVLFSLLGEFASDPERVKVSETVVTREVIFTGNSIYWWLGAGLFLGIISLYVNNSRTTWMPDRVKLSIVVVTGGFSFIIFYLILFSFIPKTGIKVFPTHDTAPQG